MLFRRALVSDQPRLGGAEANALAHLLAGEVLQHATADAHDLVRMAEREGCDLVVVGAASSRELNALAHTGGPEIAFARPGEDHVPHVGVIGAAFDGSHAGMQALRTAEALAEALHARLRVLDVVEHGPDHDGERMDWAINRVETIVHAEPVLLSGDPVDAIVRQSGTLDLLVVGHERPHLLRRSVAGELARRMPCPVLVAPKGAVVPAQA